MLLLILVYEMADKDHYMPEVDILYTVFYYMYLSLKTFA